VETKRGQVQQTAVRPLYINFMVLITLFAQCLTDEEHLVVEQQHERMAGDVASCTGV
jgi:hypothetical protein